MIYYPELAGKHVYKWYRLDKNVSWWNINVFWMGIIWGILTFEWLRPSYKFMIPRFHIGKVWLPPMYAIRRGIRK